jgi:diadenosine tetraphosphate (Ap4A) HIT family hydrolase
MEKWVLDARLEQDSQLMTSLGLCQLRLMRDSRWPWLILVPQRGGITELHDLTPLDQTMLTFELTMVGKALKEATGCAKVNVGALGNIVSQLHVHVVARSKEDPAWPGPVWGVGEPVPYRAGSETQLVDTILKHL